MTETPTNLNANNVKPDQITQNIESIAQFYHREEEKISWSQRRVERLCNLVSRPLFLACMLLSIGLWIALNVLLAWRNIPEPDPAPFFWLQGIVSLWALFTTTVVLIRQERLARLETNREHLDLQVNLLTEQKTTKLILLIEELRRDLPMVRNRRDAEAEDLQQWTDPHRVLAEIHEVRISADQRPSA